MHHISLYEYSFESLTLKFGQKNIFFSVEWWKSFFFFFICMFFLLLGFVIGGLLEKKEEKNQMIFKIAHIFAIIWNSQNNSNKKYFV